MASVSALYGIMRGRMASESASYRKMQQNAKKIKEIRGSEKSENFELGKSGGMRYGRIFRFAEAGTDSAVG